MSLTLVCPRHPNYGGEDMPAHGVIACPACDVINRASHEFAKLKPMKP